MISEGIELDWLKRWAVYAPEKVALTDGDTGQSLTYKELFSRAQKGAEYLKKTFDIQPGDRVALVAQNEIEVIDLFFALQRLGATLVPINFRLTKREVSHILEDSSPKLIVTQPTSSELVQDHPAPKMMIHGEKSWSSCLTSTGTRFEQYLANPETSALILYTSGTTGAPKGALISHRMIFWNSINTSLRLNINQSDSTVIFLPLFHTGGWNVLTTPFFHRGAHIILQKKFDADKILELSEKHRCTLLFGVPTTMDMMSRTPGFEQRDLKSIRYAIVGGEPMPIELIRTWAKKGIPVRQGYGLTEFGPNVFSLNEEDSIRKIGSIGFANFYIEVKVIDDKGAALGPDQIGELCLKGPMCMSGYWKNPKATQETIKDSWLHTGDLVRYDSEGFFYVVGRKKDMYISGGENVYPTEVEQVLRQLPQVREVAVIGVPDAKWGEVGKAFVVKEFDITETELQDHCVKNLAKFKIPKYFVFLDQLPKGDSGKILKRQLS